MTEAESLRARTWNAFEDIRPERGFGRVVHPMILILIVLNMMAVVIGSVQSIGVRWNTALDLFEYASVAIFSAEYLARVWACVEDPRYRGAVVGRVRFILSPMALIDLAAILPFYFVFLDTDLRFIRAIRLVRLARLAKLGRYSEASQVLVRVLRAKREEMILTLSLVGVLAVIFASLMYYAETDAQPDKFPDIPHALWWAFVTITTVGYGDVFPVTPLGKVIAVATAILGILMIALPTGVLGAAFVEELNRKKASPSLPRSCPHCGKTIDPS